jgi:hypothetical protein
MGRLIGGTVLATMSICLMPAAAAADERICRGAIGAETVDDLRVPQGATCELKRHDGRGKRQGRGECDAARQVGSSRRQRAGRERGAGRRGDVAGWGSVQVKQGGGADVRETRVTGDIQLDANNGALQHVARNTVGGNVQVVSNGGGVDITGNTIDGNL